VQPQPGQRAHDEVEGLPHRLSKRLLVDLDLRIGQPARADDDVQVSITGDLGEPCVLFDRRGLVGIAHQHPATPGLGDSTADRVALAPIFDVLDDAPTLAAELL